MTCKDCPKRNDCKQVCKEMQKYLTSIGIYSADYIRPMIPRSQRKREKEKYGGLDGSKWREIPFSSLSKHDIDRNPLINGG